MSRAFVKEDADTEQVIVPARPPLPEGVPNRVTPRGLALLEGELAELSAERDRLQGDDKGARQLAAVRGRIEALQDRLASARLVEPGKGIPSEVVFGATVTVRTLRGAFAGEQSRFTIVGVDEADPDDDLVAFTSPIARALLGRTVGERATLKAGRGVRELEVLAIESRQERE